MADSHLGLDYAFNPRVKRRRRGDDLFENYDRIINRAKAGDIDLVLHGGDIFYRSKFPPQLTQMAFEPLHSLANYDIPVYVVPGNHERGQIPHGLFAISDNIHIFDSPRSFVFEKKGLEILLAGFPYHRTMHNGHFEELVDKTRCSMADADARILCIHQIIEGSEVGPIGYRFKEGRDVIPISSINGFDAVLSGHIHRFQVMDNNGLKAPVMYPGSIERISFAEKDEPKGYLILDFTKKTNGIVIDWKFENLPARPMVLKKIYIGKNDDLLSELKKIISQSPIDAILRIEIMEKLSRVYASIPLPRPTAEQIRQMAPETMNIELKYVQMGSRKRPTS